MSARGKKHVKEYATDEIVVEWEPRLCYHSENCVRSLPRVFDRDRRPWVKADAATADEVEAAVARCPSGALRSRRVGAAAKRVQPLDALASADGPLLLSGGVRVVAADGTSLRGRAGGALPLRAIGQQAVLRRHAQEGRLQGVTRC